jgi:hypothetical protein
MPAHLPTLPPASIRPAAPRRRAWTPEQRWPVPDRRHRVGTRFHTDTRVVAGKDRGGTAVRSTFVPDDRSPPVPLGFPEFVMPGLGARSRWNSAERPDLRFSHA